MGSDNITGKRSVRAAYSVAITVFSQHALQAREFQCEIITKMTIKT